MSKQKKNNKKKDIQKNKKTQEIKQEKLNLEEKELKQDNTKLEKEVYKNRKRGIKVLRINNNRCRYNSSKKYL